MSNYSVDLNRLPNLMKNHEEARQGALMDGMHLAAERARNKAISLTPVDQGDMRKGWVVRRYDNIQTVDLRNDFPYAEIIERGRRHSSRPPPLAPLIEWVARHEDSLGPFGLPTVSEDGTMTPAHGTVLKDGTELTPWESDVRHMAILIQSTIGADGMEGHFILASNLELFTKWLKQEVEAQLRGGP